MYGRFSCLASSTDRQMSSSVGSAPIRSSWRWSRSSSPESFTPPSNGMLRSLLSRSRRRSSCSDGGIEEPQQLRERRSQLGAGDDRVEVAEAVVLLREAEV